MLPWYHQIIALSHYKLYYELTRSSRENLDNTHFFDLKWLLYKKNVFFRSWVMDFFFVLVHVFVIRLIACIYFTDDDHAWFAYTSLLLRHRHWSRNRGDCRPFIMESETAQWCYCLAEMKYMTSECFQWSWWFLCNARWLYDLYLMKPYKPHY